MTEGVNHIAVACRDLVKRYETAGLQQNAVDGVSLSVRKGSFALITGASGSGKTTLLNLMGCIDGPTSGEITIAGQPASSLSEAAASKFRERHIAFVFQNFNLFPVLSAYENVEYPLVLAGMGSGERAKRTKDMLGAVGLAQHGGHRPSQLSGGQKQRVAIARALVKEPTLVLADEPTANLDSETGAQIVLLMRSMQKNTGTTFVVATHDRDLFREADICFSMRDGRLTGAVGAG